MQTTLTSYGSIGPHRQRELVLSVVLDARSDEVDKEVLDQLKRLMKAMKKAA